jgi:uncharacterized protein with NRDE domain
LVTDFLIASDAAEVYLRNVQKKAAQYNGFNLIAGTPDDLWYFSNYGKEIRRLDAGIYGLSNHLLDSPWPKVKRGKEKFSDVLTDKIVDPARLFEFLYDDKQADDKFLPDTGIGLERERALSSMFIKTNGYGTRCSTVVLVDRNNNVLYSERTYNLVTFEYNTQSFQFKITEQPIA